MHPIFKVNATEMNRHVFQCRSETTDPKNLSVTLEKLTHYASKTLKAADFDPVFKWFTTPVVPKLVKPESTEDLVEITIFSVDVKEYIKRRNNLKDNLKRLYSVV